MSFTPWSRGSLLGTLDLTEQAPGMHSLVGLFQATDAGRSVLPLFQDAMTALMAIGPMLERRGITQERRGADVGQAVPGPCISQRKVSAPSRRRRRSRRLRSSFAMRRLPHWRSRNTWPP